MKQSKINKLNQLHIGWNIFFMVLLTIVALVIILPVVLIIIVSFSTEDSISYAGYTFFPLEWTLQGYKSVFKMGVQLWYSYRFSIFHTVVGTVLNLFVQSMYSFVIAQRDFRHAKFFVWVMFITMLFSGGLVPSYIVNTKYLHIGDSIWIFLLPGLMNASNCIIMRSLIRNTIPTALFDSAKIDGAGYFSIYFRIMLPLFKAGLATMGLFTVIGKWNDWFTGMLYINNLKLIPLQTLLTKMQNSIDLLKNDTKLANTYEGRIMLETMPETSVRLACCVITIAPIMLAYPYFQKYYVTGLTVGSIKE